MKIKVFTFVLLLTAALKVFSQGNTMLSKEQVIEDIDSLVYTISEVHPDMFSVCGQGEFFGMVSDLKQALPDSVSVCQLYLILQPIIVKLGDGHTSLWFPWDEVKDNTLRFPLHVTPTRDNKLYVDFSVDNKIPLGSEIIKINGVTVDEIFEKMMCYQSGETEAFRSQRVRDTFTELLFILYSADSYDIEYKEPGRRKILKATLGTCENHVLAEWEKKNLPSSSIFDDEPYSFKVLPEKNVAIMDFNRCQDPEKMEAFADSMFRMLRDDNIRNLIIDVRRNGGGDTEVGDNLLKYLSPKPFYQFEMGAFRGTPTVKNLADWPVNIGWYYHKIIDEELIQPKTSDEGHFIGNVYLLTSNRTYSAANSFSWAFKEFGIGKVVGEETGGVCVSFGEYVSYYMPNSHIQATISSSRVWQYGADEKNIHATYPDYRVPAEQALDKALKLCKP